MPLPVHDQLASKVSLAKVMLGGIDRAKAQTTVSSASLVLILSEFIQIAMTPPVVELDKKAARSVHDMMKDLSGG